jgi:hypothetical protein
VTEIRKTLVPPSVKDLADGAIWQFPQNLDMVPRDVIMRMVRLECADEIESGKSVDVTVPRYGMVKIRSGRLTFDPSGEFDALERRMRWGPYRYKPVT